MSEKEWDPSGILSTVGKVSCASRLKEALNIRHMKQADLCRLTNIPKSAMSQYINGAFEPKQDRVEIIARTLDISEAWLMGYAGVPMNRGKMPGEAGYGYSLWFEEQETLEKTSKTNFESEQAKDTFEVDSFNAEIIKKMIDKLTPAQHKKLLDIVRIVFSEDTEE